MERNTLLQEINDKAPEWFGKAFLFLLNDLDEIRQSTKSIKCDHSEQVIQLESKVTKLQEESLEQKGIISKLVDSQLKLELYHRKNNLIIEGIVESPNENISNVVDNFLLEYLKLDTDVVDSMVIIDVHRLGKPNHLQPHPVSKPRLILVKFQSHRDRSAVWLAKRNLKGTKFYISEDFPDIVRNKRQKLLPYFRAAKNHPKVKKCFLVYDKLVIDGNSYAIENVNTLPFDLVFAGECMREIPQINAVAFFGKESCLSNFHPCEIKDGKLKFSSSEMFYQFNKAMFFNDDVTAQAILKSKSARQVKAISYQIKGFNEHLWKPHARATMEKACQLKFTQNLGLQDELLQISESLVEANPTDYYFSCGLSLTNPNICDQSKWSGENVLGNILVIIRDKISRGEL